MGQLIFHESFMSTRNCFPQIKRQVRDIMRRGKSTFVRNTWEYVFVEEIFFITGSEPLYISESEYRFILISTSIFPVFAYELRSKSIFVMVLFC